MFTYKAQCEKRGREKKKMSKKVVGVVIFVVLILSSVVSYGALNAKATLISSKDKIKPGDTITITLRLSEITSEIQGVSGFETVLKYDKEVFEQVRKSDINSSWTVNYAEEQESLKIETTNGITEDLNVMILTLKAKTNAKGGSTSIEFTNSKVTNLFESVNVTVLPVTVTIEKDIENIPIQTPDKENGTEKDAIIQPTQPEDLPYAGTREVTAGIVALAVISIITFIKMKSVK